MGPAAHRRRTPLAVSPPPAAASRLLLLAGLAALAGPACTPRDESWRCRPLGPSRECASAEPVPLPGAPWACHEWRGRLLCAARSGAAHADMAHAGGAWRCRDDGRWSLCMRAGLPFPARSPGEPAAAPDGAPAWRCALDGLGVRTCRSRNFGNGPWRCENATCTQRYPDLPNRWEWECFEADGRAVCRSQTPAPADPTWRCHKAPDGQLLCVNPDPDVPDGAATGWSCRYHNTRDGARSCTSGGAHTCRSDGECRAGFCLDGRCVLVPLVADCFFAADCGSGATGVCAGGTCL